MNNISITSEIPWYSQLESWIFVSSWKKLSNIEDVRDYFSYYWRHILEWTLIWNGWFNTNEAINWSPIVRVYSLIEDSLLGYKTWHDAFDLNPLPISTNLELLKEFQRQYQKQYPIYAWEFWKDIQAIYLRSKEITQLIWFVPIVIEHILKWSIKYNQVYFLWILEDNSRWEIMVWTREKLYSLFKEIFWEDYFLSNQEIYRKFQTEDDAKKLRKNLVNPDSMLFILFKKAIKEWRISIIEKNEWNYIIIKINWTWEKVIMKSNWEYEMIN